MDPSLVFVYATVKPAEGKKDEVEAGLKEMAALVQENEPGCLRYNFFWNEDLGVFQFSEMYKDQEAYNAHKTSEHMAKAVKEGMEGKLAAAPSLHIVKPCGGFIRS